MMKTLLFIAGILILIFSEFLRIYLIMPFPGSQVNNTIDLAYWLHCNILFVRIAGILLILPAMFYYWSKRKWVARIISGIALLFYALGFYFSNFIASADNMFLQPKQKVFADVADNKVEKQKLVIGVEVNGEAKAFPIQFIGYHHQLRDTIGGQPAIVTYCTVCRSGRVFSPFVNGEYQDFRLVGMDHFNAMFEDAKTKSWWRQENGEAITGKMRGTFLDEIPSRQMTLQSWITHYPQTLIMQPDSAFVEEYHALRKFDDGSIAGSLEHTDSVSWQMKSWVIGVQADGHEKVYDWNDLIRMVVINDTVGEVAIALVLENDSMTYHAWNRKVENQLLHFELNDSLQLLSDTNTLSTWNYYGKCVDGAMRGSQLSIIPAYQEFWHSWKQFHPNSTRYNALK